MATRFFPRLHAQHPQKWGWVPNAIDAARWARAEQAFAAAGEAKVPHRFIYTSVAERGLLLLLRHFPAIRATLPGATLLVATYDPAGVSAEAHALMASYADHVTFAGALGKDALYREILRSSVWLYPTSVRETYCNVALEMMRGRVLAVASELGALRDWLGEGRGLLLPMGAPYGPEASATEFGTPQLDVAALAELLSDTPRVHAMLARARAWAEQQTWARRAERWEELLESAPEGGAQADEEVEGAQHGPSRRRRYWAMAAAAVPLVLWAVA